VIDLLKVVRTNLREVVADVFPKCFFHVVSPLLIFIHFVDSVLQ
jgi:hypothetical protein